ncbi:MAG: P-II family nitrogen regulator [Myxococcales bacterium]|nr:P-II family nitrogen regulator [Myxococcales bacterium]MCB9525694.1 P-II family nitrogen regulator [Myxococcales bacterium]
MKLLIAIIQPDKLDEVHEALVAAGITRITASRASGQGRAQEMELYRGTEVAASRMPKVRLEIALNDEFVQPCIDAIVRAARHGEGERGDGKIFVLPLERVVRISTGEEDRQGI